MSALDAEDLLTRLPAELQLRVLSCLEPKVLTSTVAKVCKGWWKISQDPLLWTRLSLVRFSETRLAAYKVILERCTLLRELEIDVSNLSSENLEVFVKACPNIEIMKLRDVDVNHIKVIVALKKLHSIELKGCRSTRVDGECVKIIAGRCEGLRSLKIVVRAPTDIQNIKEDAMCDLVEKHGSTLQELEIGGVDLTHESVIAIATCSNLIVLSLHTVTPLTDRSLEELSSLTKLKVLKLTGEEFSKGALTAFFSRPCMSLLEELMMFKMQLDNTILRDLTDLLGNLQTLKISKCDELTSRGLEHVIKKCVKLTSLQLNSMPHLTGGFLDNVPPLLPNLRELDVKNCWQLKHVCQRVNFKIPRLNVYYSMIFHGPANYNLWNL